MVYPYKTILNRMNKNSMRYLCYPIYYVKILYKFDLKFS